MQTFKLSRTLPLRLIASSVLFLFALIYTATVHAQAFAIPGTTPVGSSASSVPVSVSLPLGGTIASVKLLGQGSPNVDFAASGGTCVAGATFLPSQTCQLTVTFTPASPGQRLGAVVLLDQQGAAIGTQSLSAQATGSVGVFTPGLINTVAGDSTWVYSGDGQPATQSPIFLPFGIAVNAAGDLFIADSSNNRIRKVDGVTGLMSTYAGNGIVGSIGDGGLAVKASLNNPSSVTLDPAGNLYFADSGNDIIRRVDAFTGIITTVAGKLNGHGYTGDHGQGVAATFNVPNGIAFDAAGNLYIADTGNHAIRMLAPGGIITTVAGTGTAGLSGDGGPATRAKINAPWSATPANGGGFYIADQNNARIRFVDPSGNISTFAGSSNGFSGDGGPATSAQLAEPANVLVDVAGNVYIADTGNNRVRRVNATTGVISTFAGNNTESLSGDGGPANQAGLYGPYAFALDPLGNLFIADVFHNRIRKVSSNQAILQFPTIRVDRVSTPLTQTLENDGNAPLNLTSITPITNAQDDAGTTTCNSSTPLAPLAQCTVGVDFAPTTLGTLVFGSVNINSDAANSPAVILLSGQVLNVDPTATTLTSSVNPSATGQAVIFSVNVTSPGTTPTGTINLLDGSTVITTSTLKAGGIGSFTVSSLTSGSHSLTVNYLGDSSNAASTSPVLTQVVHDQLAATSTSIATSVTPSNAGASITLTSTVSIVTPLSGNGAITGSVAFKDGVNTLGVAQLNASGTASINVTSLSVGTHSIVASYSGSSSYAASVSVPLVESIVLSTSRISVVPAANPSIAGKSLVLTASLLSTGATPTGSVTFLDGAVTLGAAPINAQGSAILSAPGSFFTVGNHSITAVFNGDANNSGSTSAPVIELINMATSNTAVKSSLSPAGLGAAIRFTAAINTNGGTPTGTIQFMDGTTTLATAPIVATGTSTASATYSTSSLIVGTHPITAIYSGDPDDSGSTSPVFSEIIQNTTIGVSLTTSASPVVFAAPLTLTAHISGDGSTPTGTATLLDSGTTIATLPVPANGAVIFNNPSLAIGTHTLTAAYSGDTDHAAITSSALTEVVQQATTTALTSSMPRLIAGQSLTLTAAVVGVSGQPFTGSVTFSDGASILATVALTGTGPATYNTTSLAPGQHNLQAKYSGDTLDAPSTSSSTLVAVTIASTSTTFATSANPINAGSPLTLTSKVSGNGGTPTGSVTFHDGGNVLTTVPVTSSGAATFTISTLPPGIHQLSASYSGDALDATSVSPTIAQQVAQATVVSLSSSKNPSLLQDNVVLTLQVTNGVPSAPPTGSATLTDNGANLATLTLINGSATYTMQSPGVGAHNLLVNYLGDSQNAPAFSQPLTQNVTLRPSTTSFNPSATALTSGQQMTFISVVQASGSRPPTGTVTFSSGSTILGTATIDSTGLASVNVTPPQGKWDTVATYSGDSLYAPSASPAIVITVGPTVEFTINLTPSSMSMVSGAKGSLSIDIATASTFSDTLALGCAGLPTYATCTFSQNQIVTANGASHKLTVMVDTGDPLGAGATVSSNREPDTRSNTYAAAFPAGALLALLLGLNRRRFSKLNPRLALFTLLLLLAAGSTVLTGCASDLTTQHTSAGAYTFQIVASGNKTLVTQTASVNLTVTK